jgi:hypothetical protein
VTIEYEDGTAYEAINEVWLAVSPETAKEQQSAQQLKKKRIKLLILLLRYVNFETCLSI